MAELSTYARNRVQWLYELARCQEIDSNAVRVGLVIGTFLNEDRVEIRPGYGWLMKTCRIRSRTTLSKALKALKAQGFLEIDNFGGDQRLLFAFPFDGEKPWSRKWTT